MNCILRASFEQLKVGFICLENRLRCIVDYQMTRECDVERLALDTLLLKAIEAVRNSRIYKAWD
jgi:hypothetical protein